MKNIFLIMTDLDSTFEEYTKPDCTIKTQDQFKQFIQFVEEFEKALCCDVKIHFVSGVGESEIKERLNYFKTHHPDTIYKRIGECVFGEGYIANSSGVKIDRCYMDFGIYSKADGVDYILQQYKGFPIIGACFMGDSKEDIRGFKMIKAVSFNYPLGAYAICTRSQRDYLKVIDNVDFYSNKPRIIGCCECLKQMQDKIIKKIHQQ